MGFANQTHTENQRWPRLDTLYAVHSWVRTQTREPPVPLACTHVAHTTSGHSQFAYLLIVALPPFPILPLGVKHSISDLCWASLLSLYLVCMNKDRSKQRDVIVCLTGQAEEELWLQRVAPCPNRVSCFHFNGCPVILNRWLWWDMHKTGDHSVIS